MKIAKLPKVPRVFRYKIMMASVLTAVPLAITAIVIVLLLVFTKLNLYHIESVGVLINEDVRDAYYDQVFDRMQEVAPQMAGLILAIFVISFIMMNWATSPFERARAHVERTVLKHAKRKRQYDLEVSEDPVFEQLVREFCTQVNTGESLGATLTVDKRPLNLRFITKFALTFSAVSFLSGLSFSSLFLVAYDKIVSLSIHLVQGKQLSAHYYNAQQEILADTLNGSVVIALFIYFWIGRHIYKYLNLNLYAFSKAISEQRFPIAIRRREVYHEFADSLNRAYAKHKQSRI